MTNTFHGFSNLPTELRLKVWEDAIRPDELGVHFFTMEVGQGRLSGQSGIAYGMNANAALLAAAPILGAGSHRSWTDNNASTYLIDAGLWTACKESREVMGKRFQISFWREKRLKLLRENRRSDRCETLSAYTHASAPGTGRFRHGKEDWCFAVFPHRDLFCFQFSGETWPATCNHRWLTFSSRKLAFAGLKRLAFEFDDSWNFCLQGKSPWYIKEMSREKDARGYFLLALEEVVTGSRQGVEIYLIDYSVRLKHGVSGWQGFHGNGRRYVDYLDDDVESYDSRPGDRGINNFIYDLETLGLSYYKRAQKATAPTTEAGYHQIEVSRYIKILACEAA